MALTGRAVAAAAAGALVVFVAPLGGAMVGYVAAALAVAVAADLALAATPRAATLSRSGATSTRLGVPAEVRLQVRNDSGRPMHGWLRDAWVPSAGAFPRQHRIAIAPGGRLEVTTTLVPTRRGERPAAGVTLRTTGPLGLAARQRTRLAPWSVRVLPPFTSRRYLPEKLARLRELDGAVVAPVRGQGSEFDSLRAYVGGDDPRSIDWRATARRGDVVVRTWRPERDRRILLVLDTGRTAAARVGGAPRFDAALDAALLLTALAGHAGDRVTLLAHDSTVRAFVDASRGDGLAAVVRATAGIEPVLLETDMRGVVSQVLRRARRRSLVVLFTALEPAPVQEGLLPALPALLSRHTVVVASVTDPDLTAMAGRRGDSEAVYAAAAAESARADQQRVVHALQQRGAVVARAEPETFASHVADVYLGLKAAGRL